VPFLVFFPEKNFCCTRSEKAYFEDHFQQAKDKLAQLILWVTHTWGSSNAMMNQGQCFKRHRWKLSCLKFAWSIPLV